MYREFVGKSYRIVDAVFFFDLIDDERTSWIIDTFCFFFLIFFNLIFFIKN